MKNVILTLSTVALMAALAGCQDNQAFKNVNKDSQVQEREFLNDAIRHKSPDVQRVDVIDSTVVYTHIFDGIIDVKTYTFAGDVCVTAERLYTFPNQMSALRHYREAVEKADLYDRIELFDNQVRYRLKEAQYKLETEGLTKEQLKEKFDNQIKNAKVDLERRGEDIERDMKAMDGKVKNHFQKHCDKK